MPRTSAAGRKARSPPHSMRSGGSINACRQDDMSMNRKPTVALIAGCLALTGVMAASAEAQSTADAASASADFDGPTGEDTFKRVCAACHMPDAKGAEGAGRYPALAGNPRLSSGTYPVYVVMNGMNGMPPL